MFWEINESCGFRKVRILLDGDVIAVISSTFSKKEKEWESVFVPMGFSFDENKMKYLKLIINDCYDILTFLKTPELKIDEVQKFFGLKNFY